MSNQPPPRSSDEQQKIEAAQEKARRDLEVIYREHHADTIRATAALLYILHGIESIASQAPNPTIYSLKTYPVIPPHIKKDMFKNNGDVQRVAFKGWVDEVYQINERRRHKVKNVYVEENKVTKLHPDGKSYIRPEQDFLGDFRRIRNDLIHTGRATEEWTGKCKVLKWFTPPGKIVLNIDHVLEYLLQTDQIFYETDLKGEYVWKLKEETQDLFLSSHPKLLSIRTNTDRDGANNSTRHMMACIFNDGVFGMGKVGPLTDDKDFLEAQINPERNISFPSGITINSGQLYEHCLRTLKEGAKGGPGMFGPISRFRR